MKKAGWDDDRIESLLRSMPSIQETRSKEAVYASIQEKIKQEQKQQKQPQKKAPTWLVPGFATLAAAFLLIILLPVLFQNQPFDNLSLMQADSSKEESTAMDEGTMEEKIAIQEIAPSENALQNPEASDRALTFMAPEPSSHLVTAEQYANSTLLTFGVADDMGQNIVPISVLVPQDGRNEIELLSEIKDTLPIERLGLGVYPLQPYIIAEKDDTTVQVDVQPGEIIGTSTPELIFMKSLEETFRWLDYTKVEFTTDGQPGIEFAQFGPMLEKSIELTMDQAYFLYKKGEEYPTFLVPYADVPFVNIEEAITRMNDPVDTHMLLSAIPDGVTITSVVSQDQEVVIEFSKDSTLVNNDEYVYFIEAVLLTAKDFGYTNVSFNGIDNFQIGPYDLTKPIPVPIAPNLVNLD
ncbi:hypothetical protein EJF36_11670 [Bacillus sp. HMF5848]|uniref:GerMN domain-containing protein n=1 Tax=Bacillus sp. HMF5848 TaxID=2495421 RepID=UPI000F79E42E|nr:GerMN domain-containing protein [Bacillus sp. HMF5848]RSK27488.1 hypothetical protein EJF36_11670 [Bacillus sp. HMF5848]